MPLRIIFVFKTASTTFFGKISDLLNITKEAKLEGSLRIIHKNIYSSIDVDSILEKMDQNSR